MRSIKKLLAFGLFTGFMGVSNAQITSAVQPEIVKGPTVRNTGIALSPGYDLNAFAYDDGSGSWRIYWVEGATGITQDADANSGSDPDVAYYSNYKATYVTFERAGVIYVDEFFLSSIINYTRNATYPIFPGRYPNIDINSSRRGVLSWERGNDIYACTFSVAPFAMGPIVQVGTNARQPDIIALDDNQRIALTYVDIPSGRLIVETMSYPALAGGVHAPINIWPYSPTTYYQYPRIAGQRNAISGSLSDFAVVAQDLNGVGVDVRAVFVQNAVTPVMSAVPVNNGLQNCPSQDPRPVVAFNGRKAMTPSPTPVPPMVTKVDIEWSQDYNTTCTPIPFSSAPRDILLAEFSMNAMNLNGPFAYNEVNLVQSGFPSVSRHSLNIAYDGDFPLAPGACWREGTVFNDGGRMYWKERNCGNPSFINKPDELAAEQVTFSLVNNPVTQTIEVISKNDAPATFELYDNSGRLLELKEVSANGNNYSIDISHLPGGTYLLRCSSVADEEVLRVLQVNR